MHVYKKYIILFPLLIFGSSLYSFFYGSHNNISDFTGSLGISCAICHGNSTVGIRTYTMLPYGQCYTAGALYPVILLPQDSTGMYADYATQFVLKPSRASGTSLPLLTNNLLGFGQFSMGLNNNHIVVSNERPRYLGAVSYTGTGYSFPHGGVIGAGYQIPTAQRDTLTLYHSTVFSNRDTTMFNDAVFTDSLVIPPCNVMWAGDSIEVPDTSASVATEPCIYIPFNILGQDAIPMKYKRVGDKFIRQVVIND